MSNLILLTLVFIPMFTLAYAQGEMDDDEMPTSEVEYTTPSMPSLVAPNELKAAFESLAPVDRDDYLYKGASIGYQNNTTFDDSRLVMKMGPSVSYLADEFQDIKEELMILKWNQGVAVNFEASGTLMQPLIEAGLGYAWFNGERDENTVMAEALAGINFIPNKSMNIYAKAGYRFMNFDEAGSRSVGNLKGSSVSVGLGMSI